MFEAVKEVNGHFDFVVEPDLSHAQRRFRLHAYNDALGDLSGPNFFAHAVWTLVARFNKLSILNHTIKNP